MKVSLLCLANSKKTGGRCLAGVEVKIFDNGKSVQYQFVDGRPKWIRPVSHERHGEVNTDLVAHVDLLDVVTIEIVEPCPQNAQTENFYFVQEKVDVDCYLEPSAENLDDLCSDVSPLFGNNLNYVPERELEGLDYSLVFIKVRDFCFFETKDRRGAPQWRGLFSRQNIHYDLPITDPNFTKSGCKKIAEMENRVAYLTLSLGEVFQRNCYKLIAGIIIL
jgi:hypothetical protein